MRSAAGIDMANVLLGIVGVILFIGLAVAGALFLGDQFRKATARNDATIVLAQIQQMTQAIEMHRLKSGTQTFTCQPLTNLVPRYLKSIPVAPTPVARRNAGDYRFQPQANNDLVTDTNPLQAAGLPALYLTTNLGNDQAAADACQVVADRIGGGVQSVDALPTAKSGCGRYAGDYVVWQRL